MSAVRPAADPLAAMLQLEARSRAVLTEPELLFVVANETWQLVPFRQAAVFRCDLFGKPRLKVVSGLATVEDDAPYAQWLAAIAAALWPQVKNAPRVITVRDLPEALAEDWNEWWPRHALACPLLAPDGEPFGLVLYVRDEPWTEQHTVLLNRLHAAYGYGLWAISNQAGRLARWWRRSRAQRRWWRWIALAAALALFVPVRQSVLAPAEVIALEAQAIAAPMDGVVKSFSVQPNRPVREGEVIFTLDDTTLRNRREVALKALEVARADALLAAQKAFDSIQAKGELGTLQGRVREREAEVAYLNETLARVEVRAPANGVAVYGDPNDWIGRPVVTGERIVLLADPKDAGVLVWLPVADAINLEPGADMRLFLHVAPLSPLTARLTQTSYQATLSPEGIASYRIRGTFDQPAAEARVGLKGTAKLYGERVLLAYVLFRRPLAALREWTGL
jgi:hypothetical protein